MISQTIKSNRLRKILETEQISKLMKILMIKLIYLSFDFLCLFKSNKINKNEYFFNTKCQDQF